VPRTAAPLAYLALALLIYFDALLTYTAVGHLGAYEVVWVSSIKPLCDLASRRGEKRRRPLPNAEKEAAPMARLRGARPTPLARRRHLQRHRPAGRDRPL